MDEIAAAGQELDPLAERWCCLACWSSFPAGRLRMVGEGLACPVCRSLTTASASGRVFQGTMEEACDSYADTAFH